MDKVLEFAFRRFLDENIIGEEFCGKIDELFQPFCDKLKEFVPEDKFEEIEGELIDAYIQTEVLAGVEGMKLVQNLDSGKIEKIA